MSPVVPQPELLRALGRVARGLSALFWGLPLLLVAYVQTARTDLFRPLEWLSFLPALVVTGLVWHGLSQLRHYQPQERIWIRAIDRGQFLLMVNFGLTPFLAFYRDWPQSPVNSASVMLLAASSLCLLFVMNLVLQRLTAMLPDEPLRIEARLFTRFNRLVIASLPVFLAVLSLLQRAAFIPPGMARVLTVLDHLRDGLALFFVLLPLAMTMALLWKVKEMILTAIIEGRR